MNWLILALLSAFFAGLVAIFGKLGLKNIDSTLATTLRSIVMTLFLVLISLFLNKFQGFSFKNFFLKDWFYIILAGLSGALSWLFYFFALKIGLASKVAAIDRLSLLFVIFLAALFLKEALNFKSILGAILMILGAFLITLK